ncbi:MAG: hypothetical protein FJ144_01190 [Deltaproteobacteria bacterium]|nr:hypothetical protein [Deltaproteobacteria bacterium]
MMGGIGTWRTAALAIAIGFAALAGCNSGGRERAVFLEIERSECTGTPPCVRLRDEFAEEWTQAPGVDGFTAEDGYMYRLRLRDDDGKLTWVETLDRTRTAPPDYKSGNST